MSALRRLGPPALAVALVLAARLPRPAAEVARPAGAAAHAATGAASPWLEPGPLRGWRRVAAGWLLRFQPEHGAWLLDVWVPDAGGPPAWRLDVAEWLPGARLSREAAGAWLGGEAAAACEQLGRRDWAGETRELAGALPAGGGLPRSAPPPAGWLSAVLAGLLLAGATARRLDRRPPDRVWLGLAGGAAVATAALAPLLSPLGGRLLAAGVRPVVAGLGWWASLAVLMGGVVFAAATCPAARGVEHPRLLPWAFALGLAAGAVAPVGWVAELASLAAAIPALASLAVLGGWLAGLAGDGLGALAATLGPARVGVIAVLALAAPVAGGPYCGPVLAAVAAAAGGREGGAWLGLATVGGVVAGSLAAVCLWPGAQWGAWAALVAGFGATALAPWALAAGRVQSGG